MADLIERDKVLHEIDQLSHAWEYGSAVDDCYEIVKSAPSVNAEPVKHGKWIYGENLDGFDGYRCSHCMTHFAVDDVSDYHYCAYCGAKMDERKTE